MKQFLENCRYKFVLHYLVIMLIISGVTRLSLMIYSGAEVEWGVWELVKIFFVGAFYDLVAGSYFVIPAMLYLAFVPFKILSHPVHQMMAKVVYFMTIYFFLFIAVSEGFFWDEFGVRFNFISVDYLIYTTEVMGNIDESYPMPAILSVIFLISFFSVYIATKREWIGFTIQSNTHLKKRILQLLVMLSFPVLFFYTVSMPSVSKNQYNAELCKDGLYCFFSAFRQNSIDYKTFYKSLSDKEVVKGAREAVASQTARFVRDSGDIARFIEKEGTEKRHNVMMLVVESLSAEHITDLGGHKDVSPYLDTLASQSLFFRKLYATGTRTVRGMEALTLSVPPTPGRSIVKRPDNHNMFSAGFVFREKGYDTKFIYGGYGYFDNMNEFFSHNGFTIVDRNNFSPEEDTFHTAWGVCDEDLFNKAMKEADKSYSKKQPFMSFVMTTSNHRPYTYPEGRIDIPSHTSREGAVKYTDYAIGKFLEAAKSKPWFKDTIFIIVADHCASSAGEIELPVYKYHIPMYIYAPQIIAAKKVDILASQIDVMPTLFSLLNWSYESKFFGRDILSPDFKPRALIANYQKLGLYRDDVLDILLPKKGLHSYAVSKETVDSVLYKDAPTDKEREKELISNYQGATYLFDERLNRYEEK